MMTAIKYRVARVVLIILLIFAFVGLVGWQLMRPKIRTATLAEVTAELPKDLLEPLPVDPVAEGRLVKFEELLKLYHKPELEIIQNYNLSPSKKLKAAEVAFTPEKLQPLMAFLNQGPIHVKATTSFAAYNKELFNPSNLYADSRTLVLSLCQAAQLFATNGQTERGFQCLSAALTLTNRFWGLDGAMMTYLAADGLEMIDMRGVKEFVRYGKPSATQCKALLNLLPPAGANDELFAVSMRSEVYGFALPVLPDPYARTLDKSKGNSDSDEGQHSTEDDPAGGSVKSSYDAVATAKAVGKIWGAALRNTKRLYKDMDRSGIALQMSLITGLPTAPDSDMEEGWEKKWAWTKYRFMANNTSNFYGRTLVGELLSGESSLQISCHWRAMRNAVRVLLASRIYRSRHGGALPSSAQELVPILGTWPIDVYDGKPMRYDAKKQVVYSVGENLVDDGGDLGGPTSPTHPDVGLLLTP